ncbi:hypothetical protein F2P81_014516 [Scophthalmus maximus]|uniref:Uncharacterized protein n=1 Tax=Scophthalmus maximus TaxID=52904 RepID=A0A6A4SAK1_SCOMX|nr:hypothetical protein F2P81_014516 [Scophthalmus maximus]
MDAERSHYERDNFCEFLDESVEQLHNPGMSPMRTLLHTHCQRSNTSEIAELCCDCAASAWCTDATEELCVTLRLQRLLTRSSGMMD